MSLTPDIRTFKLKGRESLETWKSFLHSYLSAFGATKFIDHSANIVSPADKTKRRLFQCQKSIALEAIRQSIKPIIGSLPNDGASNDPQSLYCRAIYAVFSTPTENWYQLAHKFLTINISFSSPSAFKTRYDTLISKLKGLD
ncbi:hypothetical protein N0V88_001680 [Collariella sp. IMI 366227]|nr:hypothetical protein N0V88_001680 [Collariella sp. IMI 366227]